MNVREEERDYGFLTGIALGGIVGAGLALWLAPRAAGKAKTLVDAMSGRYRDARLRINNTVEGLSRKGQGIRDEACDTVVRAAQEVEAGARGVQHFATDAKTQIG